MVSFPETISNQKELIFGIKYSLITVFELNFFRKKDHYLGGLLSLMGIGEFNENFDCLGSLNFIHAASGIV